MTTSYLFYAQQIIHRRSSLGKNYSTHYRHRRLRLGRGRQMCRLTNRRDTVERLSSSTVIPRSLTSAEDTKSFMEAISSCRMSCNVITSLCDYRVYLKKRLSRKSALLERRLPFHYLESKKRLSRKCALGLYKKYAGSY